MTDLDPLARPPAEGSELAARAAREQRDRAPAGMDGPTGHAMATESAGDPDRATLESGAEAGAGAGAIAGAAVAGPFGMPIGAAAGAVAGTAAEAADDDADTNQPGSLSAPGSEGTVADAPAAHATAEEHRGAATDRS